MVGKIKTVVSLSDGIGGSLVALKKIKAEPDNYFAFEMSKDARSISAFKNPDMHQMKDSREFNPYHIKERVDLLIGKSLCADIVRKARKVPVNLPNLNAYLAYMLNAHNPRLPLPISHFWEFVRFLKATQPRYFLFESVKLHRTPLEFINDILGFEGELIDAGTISAQRRVRMYWLGERKEDGTYRKIRIKPPITVGGKISDIVHETSDRRVDEEYLEPFKKSFEYAKQFIESESVKKGVNRIDSWSGADKPVTYHIDCTLTEVDPIQRCITLNDRTPVISCLGVDIPEKRGSGVRLRSDGKSGTLTRGATQGWIVETYLREATPIEYERLQGFPDNYSKIGLVSNVRSSLLMPPDLQTCDEVEIPMRKRRSEISSSSHVEMLRYLLSILVTKSKGPRLDNLEDEIEDDESQLTEPGETRPAYVKFE